MQVDRLTVTLEPNDGVPFGKHREVVKHFSAVDLFSRFSLAVVHSRAGFLRGLVLRAPFPVRAVQVDGGSEFMAEFEWVCQSLGIELFVLPPRSPKLNGHVERMQRTLRDEFYTQPLPSRVAAMQEELEGYLAYYNTRRPHMALGGLAPMEYLARLKEGGSQSRMY